MESERPHRITGNTSSSSSSSEFFICFTSRLSFSSMKISSKSILSPGRARDPAPISLSTSLSRRLRTNASMKGAGQASPMFPTSGVKKRGCAFENPEPSSPKVTCIGQVRVKSKKKQGKKLRSLSRRHSTGEVSFRKLEQSASLSHSHSQRHGSQNLGQSYQQCNGGSSNNQETLTPQQRNQRWVHLPLTICEALRTFGSEFSCLFPCSKSSCFSTSEREKEESAAAAGRSGVGVDAGQQSSCGAVFRWLVALQDGEGTDGKGGRREIELVMRGDDNDIEQMRTSEFMEGNEGVRNSRRHVFEDLEIVDNRIEVKDEEAARISICVPPKNALLLMRCRSDPVKMEALTSKFWESPVAPPVDEFGEEDEEDREEEKEFKECEVELKDEQVLFSVEVDEEEREDVNVEAQGNADAEANLDMELKQTVDDEEEEDQGTRLDVSEVMQGGLEEEETELVRTADEDESLFLDCLFEEFLDELEHPIQEEEAQAEATIASRYTTPMEVDNEEEVETLVEELAALELEAKETIEEKETQDCNFDDEKEMVTHERSKLQADQPQEEATEKNVESEERESESQRSALPECLLLMMCEPKLSMEVSRETWVCSTDFIRPHPERKKQQAVVKPIDGGDKPIEKTVNADASSTNTISNNPAPLVAYNAKIHHQPPRSSCSLPGPAAAASMATMLEQKLVNAVEYEPFVLTRCKSEPMRKASQLVPETCFWKNRKLEPLRRAAYGVRAAGLGF